MPHLWGGGRAVGLVLLPMPVVVEIRVVVMGLGLGVAHSSPADSLCRWCCNRLLC
jgi:hypothetical protein